MTSAHNFWALLIGIGSYQAPEPLMPPLNGSVNDVRAMQDFLQSQYGVPDDHITTLIDEQATRQAILDAFESCLIDNTDVQSEDQVLIYFAGHGILMDDHTGLSAGRNQALVPYDWMMDGIFPIPDKTLAALAHLLVGIREIYLTIVVDSCYSGSIVRKIGPQPAASRWAAAETRPVPHDLDQNIYEWAHERGVYPTHHMPYTVLSACRETEEASEHRLPSGTWHGSFTYHMLKVLSAASSNISYDELCEAAAVQIAMRRSGVVQTPQCEGEINRAVFGDYHINRDPFILVTDMTPSGRYVTVDAGYLHGLSEDSQLAFYPPDVRHIANLPEEPLATGIVTEVLAGKSIVEVTNIVPPLSRVIVDAFGPSTKRQNVYIDLDQQDIREYAENHPSRYIALVDEPQASDICLVKQDSMFYVTDPQGVSLIHPDFGLRDRSKADIVDALRTISRFRLMMQLNDPHYAVWNNQFSLHLKRFAFGEQGQPEAVETGAVTGAQRSGFHITLDLLERHNRFVLEIHSQWNAPLFVHIFYMNPDFSIELISPQHGQQLQVTRDSPLRIGLPETGEPPLELFLPEGWQDSQDYLKVIFTQDWVDLSSLAQDGLLVEGIATRPRSSLPANDLLVNLIESSTRPGRSSQVYRWTSLTVPVHVIAPERT